MATHHGSKKWTLFGGGFEIDPLDNGRYRVTIRCKHHRLNEDYYYANKDEIFKAFGSAYDLPLDEGGVPSDWRPLDGEEYPDQILIDTKYRYPQGSNVPILEFIYETLTSTWTNEIDDQTSSTDSGLRILERTQVAKPGTAAPYNEDDVGVVTISDGGKTLYLAGFDNNSTDRKGIFITRWAEAGILSVRTPKVGGQQTVEVQAFAMTEAAVTSALSEVTGNHNLIDESTGKYEGFQTKNYVFEVDDFEVVEYSETGLKRLSRIELSESDFVEGDIVIGTTTYSTLYAAGQQIDNGNTIKKRTSRWAAPGLLDAQRSFTKDGLLLVTFQSQGIPIVPTALNNTKTLADPTNEAFQGGSVVAIHRMRETDPEGFVKYVRAVLLDKAGGEITSPHDFNTKQQWVQVFYPGIVNTDRDKGIEAIPGSLRWVKATVTETLTTSANVDATPPYSIVNGAYAHISFIPTATGIAQSIARAFSSKYLSGSAIVGSGGDFLGAPVTNIVSSVSSNPSKSTWLALSGQRLAYDHSEAHITDLGTQWYRERKVVLIGSFGDYAP